MSYCLTISIRENPYNGSIPFLSVDINTKWVYVLSEDPELLHSFKEAIEQMTPHEYLRYITIEILETNSLNDGARIRNGIDEMEYENDQFYLEGIVNNGRYYSLPEFDISIWRWW